MTVAGATIRASEEFAPPGPGSFELPPVFADVTKPMILLTLSVVVIFAVTYAMARKSAVVPGRLQFAGEYVYGFVRNGIARDSIGSQDFMRYVPYLFSLFTFVLLNNYYGIIPFLQFPSFSRASFAYALAGLTWLIYNGAGVAKHGLVGYLKLQTLPAGVTGPILLLIVPLEFASNILVRPVTLALRLFANMFAGHLLLILFAVGAEYLIFESGNGLYIPVGILSFVLGIAVSFLEVLILFLQAYVFTLLSAMYIGSAIADEH
ncbi:MAG: F0F1 ATP synthase subunit A [Nocardioidaceae bacterium]|nr:F0F1 ATP synthase subunit A [Nocardioidaceae bacterium]